MTGATLTGTGTLGSAEILLPVGTTLGGTGGLTAGAASYAPVITFPGRGPNALGLKVELLLNTTWTDITLYVMLRDPVRITGMGRADESGSITSGQLTMTLKNDGRFTPKNTSGAYYPNIVRNAQVRVSVNATSGAGIPYVGYRFWGEVSAWPPAYDISQRDVYVQVTASGVWRRISQSQTPIGSCYWRYVNLLTGSSIPAAYWSMEDGSGSANFALTEGTGTNMVPAGTPSYAADGTSFGGSNAIPQLNGARLAANVTMGSTPSSLAIRWAMSVPAAGDSTASTFSGGGELVKILTNGTVATISVSVTGNQLVITGSNSGGTQLFSGTIAPKVNGVPVLCSYEQTAGAWAFKIVKPGAATVTAQVTQSGFSWTVDKVTQVQVNDQGRFTDTSLGQMGIWSLNTIDIIAAASNLGGRAGELAGDRFLRLCTESNITATVTGGGGAPMGPQVSDTLANLLQGIEDTDGGLLSETTGQLGLNYRTLASMLNQVPAVQLAYTTGALGAVPAPVYDDQLAKNSWTLTNYDGYAALAQCTSGAMSVQPPPNGLGSGYSASKNVNTTSHATVNATAQQLLFLGCCDEVRFPSLTFNFQRAAAGSYFASVPSMRLGDYLSVSSLPSFLGGGTTKQLIWGWSETLGGDPQGWTIAFNTVPESPFETGFSPGVFSVAQTVAGAVAAGSQVGSSVSGSQLGNGAIPGLAGGTLSARGIGGITQYVGATTPYDWSFAVSSPAPADNTYFTCTSDQALPIVAGDTFTHSAGLGGPFTVTSVDQQTAGLANVHFTPTATSAMSSGTVYGGKNGDSWVNTAGGNQISIWTNGVWVPVSFGPGAMSFSVNGLQVTFAATAPSSPNTGDLWYDTSNGNRLNQWNGSSWVQEQFGTNAITAGSITASLIAANTITAAQIAANTITATQIAAGTITATQIASGTIVAGNIAASTITASQIASGIVLAGVVNGTTITGATLIADGTSGEILVYSGTPALGNLIGSWSGAAGTDTPGNAFSGNLEVHIGGLVLDNQSSAPTGVSGASTFYSSVRGRPRYISQSGDDSALDRSVINVTTFTPSGGNTIATAISATMNYQAGEGSQSSEYEIEIDGIAGCPTGGSGGGPQLTMALYLDGASWGASFTVGATSFPIGGGNTNFTARFRAAILSSGTGGTALLVAEGSFNRAGTAAGNATTDNTSVGSNSGGSTKSIDTTVAHTLQVYSSWSTTSNTGHGLTTYLTRMTRRM